MNLFAKLAVIAGLAVMPLSMAATSAFAATAANTGPTSCQSWQHLVTTVITPAIPAVPASPGPPPVAAMPAVPAITTTTCVDNPHSTGGPGGGMPGQNSNDPGRNHGYPGSGNCGCSTQPPVIKFLKPVTPDPRCHYIGADVKGFQPFGNDNCNDPQGCQWQDQGNGWHLTGFDSQGRQNDGRDHGSDGWNCDHGIPGHACYKQTVTFLYSHAYGSWLQLVSPQALVPGEILTYDHKTWTVGQWTPHGHGDRPGGDWFTLTDAYGHILNGSGNALQTAHTICKYVA